MLVILLEAKRNGLPKFTSKSICQKQCFDPRMVLLIIPTVLPIESLMGFLTASSCPF